MEKLYEALLAEFMEVHRRHEEAVIPSVIEQEKKLVPEGDICTPKKPYPIKYIRQRGQKISYLSNYEIEQRKKS